MPAAKTLANRRSAITSGGQSLRDVIRNYKRVTYKQNPLVEVICQVRFPTILSIELEVLAKLQDHLRPKFPKFEQIESHMLVIGPASEPPTERPRPSRAYNFYSEDKSIKLGLTSGFFSISTKSYTKWEEFFRVFNFFGQKLIELYEIRFISRIELRYRNAIGKSLINETETKWSDLVVSQVLGLLAREDSSYEFLTAHSVFELQVNDIKVMFQHGLIVKTKQYLLDFDLSIGGERAANFRQMKTTLTDLHELSGPLFRWSITEKLHEKLGPKPV